MKTSTKAKFLTLLITVAAVAFFGGYYVAAMRFAELMAR